MKTAEKTEQEKLNAIARSHSYAAGFNGRMSKYRMALVQEFTRSLPRSTRVLEIGAGEGPITADLVERFDDVTAIEPAKNYFDILNSRFKGLGHLRLIQALFEEADLTGPYGLVVACGVLEHVRDVHGFLQKASALMSSGALFLATVPNATSLHRRIGVSMGMLGRLDELSEQDRQVGHFRYYDFETFRQDIEAGGFHVQNLDGLLLKPFPNSKMDELSEAYCNALFAVGRALPEWCAEIFVSAKKG